MNDSSATGSSNQIETMAETLSPGAVGETVFFDRNLSGDFDVNPYVDRLLDTTTEMPPDGCLVEDTSCVIDTTSDVIPDAITMHGYALHYTAFWSAFQARNPRPPALMFHTARIASALEALGAQAEGLEGVSHVLLDDAESGQTSKTRWSPRPARWCSTATPSSTTLRSPSCWPS